MADIVPEGFRWLFEMLADAVQESKETIPKVGNWLTGAADESEDLGQIERLQNCHETAWQHAQKVLLTLIGPGERSARLLGCHANGNYVVDAIDSGVLLYLIDHYGMDARSVEHLLTHESGLLGVSGISSDMRTLLERETNEPHAAEAIELFVYRISREIGSLAAALSGIDSLVFTGGIGEHAAPIRARVCHAASWLGLELDEISNEQSGPRISRSTSRVSAWVIPTNEELMIAHHTQHLLKPRQL